jgi:hypothetical protein
MDWNIDYSPLPVYIRIATEGPVSFEDTKAMWDEILASREWIPGTCVLFDSGSVRPRTVGDRVTDETAHYFIEREKDIGECLIAVFRGHPEIYRFSSQFQYAIRMRGSSVVIRNFSTEKAAIEWLSLIAVERQQAEPLFSSASGDR